MVPGIPGILGELEGLQGVYALRYQYVINYKNNDRLRGSLNALTRKTFGFHFEEWYRMGFWGERYIPHSLVDGEQVIANVSASRMDFQLDGEKLHFIQLGTVMTNPDYRGQGLGRLLMERVLEEYESNCQGIYLFGNDSVKEFYPKFGFQKGEEYRYTKSAAISENIPRTARKIDLSEEEERMHFLAVLKNKVPQYRLSMDNFGLDTFYSFGPFRDNIYFVDGQEAYAVVEPQDGSLVLQDVFCRHPVDMDKLIGAFGQHTNSVQYGFVPLDGRDCKTEILQREDCTFFYRGERLKLLQKQKLMFPTFSHA